MDIIPVFLNSFLRHFEHDKKYGFLIVYRHIKVNHRFVLRAITFNEAHDEGWTFLLQSFQAPLFEFMIEPSTVVLLNSTSQSKHFLNPTIPHPGVVAETMMHAYFDFSQMQSKKMNMSRPHNSNHQKNSMHVLEPKFQHT